MKEAEELAFDIKEGRLRKSLETLYGSDERGLISQQERYSGAVTAFAVLYGDSASQQNTIRLLSVPGRSEIGGNHTDHNNGKVLACSVDLDIIAVVRKNEGGPVRIQSEGFSMDVVDLSDLGSRASERFKSAALIKGVLAKLQELGYKMGGFDAYTTTSVLKGSGLSSSAAFEIMVVTIISHLYNDGNIDPVVMAEIAQFAESVYFGKPCGLMDQLACAIGGLITIDFANPLQPIIEKLDFDFSSTGSMLCVVNTEGDHADLNEDYSAIRNEMKAVAKAMGHENLRECDESEFYKEIAGLRQKAGDRAVLRAIHFFSENERVTKQVEALKNRQFESFRQLIIESGRSSFMYLQNCYPPQNPFDQGISLGLALAEKILSGRGAWRVHGGGFAGTMQAFVAHKDADQFITTMNGVFGETACHCLQIRPAGAVCLL